MEISIKKEQGNLDGHVLYAITAEEIQKFSNKFNVTRTEIDCLLKDSRYVIQLNFSQAKAIKIKELILHLNAEFPEILWTRFTVDKTFVSQYELEFLLAKGSFDFSKQKIETFLSKVKVIVLEELLIPIRKDSAVVNSPEEKEIDKKNCAAQFYSS